MPPKIFVKITLIGLLILSYSGKCTAQMSGIYTINGDSTTSGTNFNSFTDAFNSLMSQGVNGPVTIYCHEGTYTENAALTSTISGTSTTNTITIDADSNNTSDVTIVGVTYYAFRLANQNNITIRNISFSRTYSAYNAYAAVALAGSLDNVLFTECNISGPDTTWHIGILGHTAVIISGQQFNNVEISNNTITKGDYGIKCYNSTSTNNLVIKNNHISDFLTKGIYVWADTGRVTITENTIVNLGLPTDLSNYGAGIEVRNLGPGSIISRNNVHLSAVNSGIVSGINGMYLWYTYGTSSNPIKIENNIFKVETVYGGNSLSYLFLNHTHLHNNTFWLNGSGRAIYEDFNYSWITSVGNELKNNIIYCETDQTGIYNFYGHPESTRIDMSNNIYGRDSSNAAKFGIPYTSNIYYSLSAWQTATGQDQNSQALNPQFTSTGFEPQSPNLFNTGLDLDIDIDIYGNERDPTNPDPGAVEVFNPHNNAQPGPEVFFPYFCDSIDHCTVVIKNTGLSPLNSVVINYQIDNGLAQYMTWTGVIAPFEQDSHALSSINVPANSEIKIWTSMPNGVQDSMALNDTIYDIAESGMAGEYFIPADFATLNQARNALVNYGVCSHVYFTMSSSIYNEQVSFPEIQGTGPNATIEFRSATGNWADVKIVDSVDNTIELAGIDWITFKNITIECTNENPIEIVGESDHVTFDSVWIKGTESATLLQDQALINAIAVTDDLNLINCRLAHGSIWMYSTVGSDTNMKNRLYIADCEMKHQRISGSTLSFYQNIEIHESSFTNTENFYGNTGSYPIGNLTKCQDIDVSKNRVFSYIENGWGTILSLTDCSTSESINVISNNCLLSGNETSTNNSAAIQVINTSLLYIYNNTITRLGVNNAIALRILSGDSISIVNNNISNHAGGRAISVSNDSSLVACDHNNFFSSTNIIARFDTNNVTEVDSIYPITGHDEHSLSVDPDWTEEEECITCIASLDQAGTSLEIITDDINHEIRNSLYPDIGAVEYKNTEQYLLGPDDTICTNSTVVGFSAEDTAYWTINGQSPTYAPFIELTTNTNTPTFFSIYMNLSIGTCGSVNEYIDITLIPEVNLDSHIHICLDSTLRLNANGINGTEFLWSTSETTQRIYVDTPGVYWVEREDYGCVSSDTVIVTQSEKIEIDDQLICGLDLPYLIDGSVQNGVTYNWSGGLNQDSAINYIENPGMYFISIIDEFQCSTSDSFAIEIEEQVPLAVISETHVGNLYDFDAGNSQFMGQSPIFQWDLDINGQSDSTITTSYHFPWSDPNNLTVYIVELIVQNVCGADTDTMHITPFPTGIASLSDQAIKIYPNPVMNKETITWNPLTTNLYSIKLIDPLGRILMKKDTEPGAHEMVIGLGDLPSGPYFIQCTLDEGIFTYKILKL